MIVDYENDDFNIGGAILGSISDLEKQIIELVKNKKKLLEKLLREGKK